MNKKYIRPTIIVMEIRTECQLLAASGGIDNTPKSVNDDIGGDDMSKGHSFGLWENEE